MVVPHMKVDEAGSDLEFADGGWVAHLLRVPLNDRERLKIVNREQRQVDRRVPSDVNIERLNRPPEPAVS